MSAKRKVFFLLQLGFGALVTLGALFEVVNLLVPSLFPALQDNPLMRLHHTNRVVFVWTLGSNLLTIPLGLLIARSALLGLSGSAEASRIAKPALVGFAAITLGAVVVSGKYLVAPGFAPAAGPLALVVAISVISSWFGLGTTLGLLFWGHRRLARSVSG